MSFLEKAMSDLYDSVHGYVGKAFKTLSDRMTALEQREIPAGKDGAPGKDAEVDYDRIGTAIKEVVAVAVSEIPIPKDGERGEKGDAGEKGDKGDPGENGKDADPELIAAEIQAGIAKSLPDAVDQAIKALLPEIIQKATEGVPVPKDGEPGRDADIEKVREIVTGEVARALEARRQKDEEAAAGVYETFIKGLQDVA